MEELPLGAKESSRDAFLLPMGEEVHSGGRNVSLGMEEPLLYAAGECGFC